MSALATQHFQPEKSPLFHSSQNKRTENQKENKEKTTDGCLLGLDFLFGLFYSNLKMVVSVEMTWQQRSCVKRTGQTGSSSRRPRTMIIRWSRCPRRRWTSCSCSEEIRFYSRANAARKPSALF